MTEQRTGGAEVRPLWTLEYFVEVARELGMEDFVKRFREPFLVAMGVLEAEEIQARCGATVGVRISSPPAHDRKEVHPLAGRVITVPIESAKSGSLVVGRDESADVAFHDDTVSTRHCLVQWEGAEVSVTDLDSTNGTFVNLRPVRPKQPRRLRSEDIVTVGRFSFQFFMPRQFYRVLEGLGAPVDEGSGAL